METITSHSRYTDGYKYINLYQGNIAITIQIDPDIKISCYINIIIDINTREKCEFARHDFTNINEVKSFIRRIYKDFEQLYKLDMDVTIAYPATRRLINKKNQASIDIKPNEQKYPKE